MKYVTYVINLSIITILNKDYLMQVSYKLIFNI